MEESDVVARYITTVGPNDVLLGRGAPIINNEGNVRFRKIVAERKDEYKASCRHQLKNAIAKDIIDEVVKQRNGRFLRMVDDLDELKEKGHIPIDAKSAWVIADNMVILQKVKQALRELDDTPISTTSSTERKRRKTNSPTTTSTTMSSSSKRKRSHHKQDDQNVSTENSIELKKEKPIKVLDESRVNTKTISVKSESTPLKDSQKYGEEDKLSNTDQLLLKLGEGDNLNKADIVPSLAFTLKQQDSHHSIPFETSHKNPTLSKNHLSRPNVTNLEQQNQQSLRLDHANIRSTDLRERMTMTDPMQETRRTEQRTQLQEMPMRQSELFHDELMNIQNVLQEDQSNKPVPQQNQHMYRSSKVYDESNTSSAMIPMHQIANFDRMPFLPDQSHDMMTLKQQGTLDVNSLDSADQLFLRRQRLLYAQQEQQRNIMLLQCQLQQEEEQHQLLQLEHRNNYHQDIMRNSSSWHHDAVPMINPTILESDLPLNNRHQQSQPYRNNILNSNEMLEPSEINDLNQYQIQLEQQQYLANMFPSEYVSHSSSIQDMRSTSINDRNDYTNIQQHSIQQDTMPIQFTNQMDLYSDRPYRNSNLHFSQLPDSSNDRLMTSSMETNVTDLYRNQDNIQSLRTNNEDDKIDDEQIAVFKKFLERDNAL